MHVIFAVKDVARSVEFYEHVFGWPRNDWIDYSNYVELKPPEGGALGLYERKGYAGEVGAEPVETNGRVSPAYLYVRVENVEASAARLAEAGARPLSPLSDRAWGERAAWFADPDGNVVAVAQSTAG